MKYIFVTGAPGSKWSSVVKNIYYSDSIDRSDYRDSWTYYHDASGTYELMHLGAYYDPGMEFGNFFDSIEPIGSRNLLRGSLVIDRQTSSVMRIGKGKYAFLNVNNDRCVGLQINLS